MKLPKFSQLGIAHILAPIVFIGIFAAIGGIVLLKSHAQTPQTSQTTPTIVKTFRESAKEVKLGRSDSLQMVNGRWLVVIKQNIKYTGVTFSNTKLMGSISQNYRNYKFKVCADINYPTEDGNIMIANFGYSTGFIYKDVKASNVLSSVCTPYGTLKKLGEGFVIPEVRSDFSTAYLKSLSIVVAK